MPALDTIYSPIIEPIQAIPTLIFSIEIKFGKDDGMTSLVKICSFVAPIDCNRSNLFLSVAINPLNIFKMATISPIKTVINTMALLPVPHQIIISGPRAILGKAFNTTKYGSLMRRAASLHQSNRAMVYPKATAIKKPANVSQRVVPT